MMGSSGHPPHLVGRMHTFEDWLHLSVISSGQTYIHVNCATVDHFCPPALLKSETVFAGEEQ